MSAVVSEAAVLSRSAGARAADTAAAFEKDLRSHADHPRLTAFIDHAVSEGLVAEFASWDEKAKQFQRDHRGLVNQAVWGGVFGALFGIVRFVSDHILWSILEMVCFGWAGIAVWKGLQSSRRDRWLLARYEAERRRLKLFELASDPVVWGQTPPPDWSAFVRAGMDSLPHLPEKGIEALAHSERAPRLLHPAECPVLGRAELTALVGFYREAHLDVQMDYFSKKAETGPVSRTLHKEWVSYAFFLVVLFFAFLHVGLEALAHDKPKAMVALAISAGVAGIWAAVRTWRSANEFVRNTTRAEAKLSVLKEHCRRLESELAGETPDSWTVFVTLRLCDAVLRGDQREWLGLMHEAEWF